MLGERQREVGLQIEVKEEGICHVKLDSAIQALHNQIPYTAHPTAGRTGSHRGGTE